ncbi:MAG TPA: hypothetical protein VF763_00280 [Candidatus Limnocylindrales bacterium]
MSASTPDLPRWDLAASSAVAPGARRRAELAALPAGEPDLATLFTFMRDAELRFATLRLRIEERTWAAVERVETTEVLVRHPGLARVTTSVTGDGEPAGYDVWLGDGRTVRTYSTISRVTTERPVRRRVGGLAEADLPGPARVYEPLTALPMETLAETFVHPAGFCQNVLTTGACRVAGRIAVAGREAVLVECDHPRVVERYADLPDHRLEVAADDATGLVVRLVETIGGRPTRVAEAVSVEVDAPIPDSAFSLAVPADAHRIY